MKILFCGDVVGRSGREVITNLVPRLRYDLKADVVIVNGENAAHGFGINKSICEEFYKAGVDVITTGNHVWDQKELISTIQQDKRLLRPINYPSVLPGRGFTVIPIQKNREILIINAMARLFMEALDDPFAAVDTLLKQYPLGGKTAAIFLDFHGEATSEKMAMGHFCDGRASAVIGTHCHVPTADTQIFPRGTAYQTDAGMCGDYNSVVGMQKEVPLERFTRKFSLERLTPAQGPATLCGTYIETDDKTGLATTIMPLRLGPRLMPCAPKELRLEEYL